MAAMALAFLRPVLMTLGASGLIGSIFDGSTQQQQPQQQPYVSVYPQTGNQNAVQYQPSIMSAIESWIPFIGLGIGGWFLWTQMRK